MVFYTLVPLNSTSVVLKFVHQFDSSMLAVMFAYSDKSLLVHDIIVLSLAVINLSNCVRLY